MNFRNKLSFYGEEFLAQCPTSKLKDHPLSAVHNCLFNIFAATLHIWRPSPPSAPEDAPCRGDKEPTYKTMILPVVLYTCKTWSLTLREEYRLRVFENRVLMKIFGPKRDEVKGKLEKIA
jgi:hypothetical protein